MTDISPPLYKITKRYLTGTHRGQFIQYESSTPEPVGSTATTVSGATIQVVACRPLPDGTAA